MSPNANRRMLPTSAIRLYARYKANSKELFQPIHGRDLRALEDWSADEVAAYKECLAEGYVRNSISFGARKKFRDQYVPTEKRDEGHEAAIEAAENNCATYARLYRELLAAVRRVGLSERKDDEPTKHWDDGATTPRPQSVETHTTTAEESDEDILTSAWEAAMKERAERETEVERFVAELYARSENIIRSLKVADTDVIPILDNLLRLLAPSVSVRWEWGDEQATAELVSRGEISDDDLRAMIVKAAVRHRKFERSLDCIIPAKWMPPQTTDATTRGRYHLVTLLFLINECRSQLMSGSYAWSATHLVALRECTKHFRAHGEFRGVPLRKPPSRQELDSGGKALIADILLKPLPTTIMDVVAEKDTLVVSRPRHAGKKPPVPKRALRVSDPVPVTQQAAWSEALRVWKGVVRKQFRGSEPPAFLRLVITTFTRVLNGSVDFTTVVIHPAQFLRDAAVIPDAESLAAATHLLRTEGDRLSPMLSEIYKVLTAAEGIFDLQYFDHYEDFAKTGKMPHHLGDRNPFEEDENNVVCGLTKLMKERDML